MHEVPYLRKTYDAFHKKGFEIPAAQTLGISAIPKMFLLDPDGKLIAVDLRGDLMIQKVKELLQQ